MFYIYCDGRLWNNCQTVEELIDIVKDNGVTGNDLLLLLYSLGKNDEAYAKFEYVNYDGFSCLGYLSVFHADHDPDGIPFSL